MKIDSKELEEYVKSSLMAIKRGVDEGGFYISSSIEFNVAVTNSKEGGGGLKIYIASTTGKRKSEEVSHIKFQVRPTKPLQPLKTTSSK